MKITFWFAILSLFAIAVIIFAVSIISINNSLDKPIEYTTKMVDGNLIIHLTSPTLDWNVLLIALPSIIVDVIVFLHVYANEYSFPIYIPKQKVGSDTN